MARLLISNAAMTPDDYIRMCDQTLDAIAHRGNMSMRTKNMRLRVMLVRTHYVKLKQRAEKENYIAEKELQQRGEESSRCNA